MQLARDPGYARLPDGGTQTIYFGDRGAQTFNGLALLDLAATYQIPVFRTVSPWVKVEILNLTEQPEADLVGHDGHAGPEQPAGRQRAADRLHPGSALRPGHLEHQLPGLAARARPGGRTYLLSGGIRF